MISHVLDLSANPATHYTLTKWKSEVKKPQAICSEAVSKVGFGWQSKHIICLSLTYQLKTKMEITEESKMHPKKLTINKPTRSLFLHIR